MQKKKEKKVNNKNKAKNFGYSLFVIWSCGSHFVTTHSGTNFVIRAPRFKHHLGFGFNFILQRVTMYLWIAFINKIALVS